MGIEIQNCQLFWNDPLASPILTHALQDENI